MTRDEAIDIECKKLRRISIDGHYNSTIAAANIDSLIELGLLKVDEPKKATIIMDINTFDNGRMIVYQHDHDNTFTVWYHGKKVWDSAES